MKPKRVLVVGAGLGGLSAAARLASRGYSVDVYEKNSLPGGKAASRKLGPYRFDTGPSLFTMPNVFEDFFRSLGLVMKDHLSPIPLSPITTYYLSDGTRLSSYSDILRFGREIEEKTADSAAALEGFLGNGKRIYDRGAELFLYTSLQEKLFRFGGVPLKTFLGLGDIDPFRSLHRANSSFFTDTRLVQLFDRYATYNGSSPFRAPATLGIIPYVEHSLGGFAVEGGIISVPRALERAGRLRGARFHYDEPAERILVEKGPGVSRPRRVCGLKTAGGEIPADIVVCNADVGPLYRDLLGAPEAKQARRYDRLEPSTSGLVFLWGISRSFPELTVNNIFFSKDYKTEFDELFRQRTCPSAPTVYVNITSKATPADAPPGCENWFVLVNAPASRGQDWAAEVRKTRRAALDLLRSRLGIDIEPHIEAEEIITPPDIEAETGSRYGSLYGISSNTPLAAFLRHPNRAPGYGGLYVCGGSVHPGGGMPLAVLSGKIAAELVEKYEGPA
jgi:phytoene desaturase